MKLIRLTDLTAESVRQIWRRACGEPGTAAPGVAAFSFEGNGIRTRTTFIRAFRELGLDFIELPNLLKTSERVEDLAGYLDPFYDVYVVREPDHARLAAFAQASRRPVVNAMSREGHPCEVLTDAFFVDANLAPIEQARVCLWGPPTNVFHSWHELAQVMGFPLIHVCASRHHRLLPNVSFVASCPDAADVVITDGWPAGAEEGATPLTLADLDRMGRPHLLPTPPFTVGGELAFDPVAYERFTGYGQKRLLLDVQKAILVHLLDQGRTV